MDAGDGICEDTRGGNNSVCGCDGGDGHGVVLETKGIGESFPTSSLHYYLYASIMLQGRANVPTVVGVEAPGFVLRRFEIDKEVGALWSHGGSGERKRAFHGLEGKECRILMAWVQHVHGVITLVCDAAPVCNRKGFWKACNPGGKVVLPRPNGPLGGVRVMYVRGCILEGSLL